MTPPAEQNTLPKEPPKNLMRWMLVGLGALSALRYIWKLDEFSEEGKEAKAEFLQLVPPEQLGVRVR